MEFKRQKINTGKWKKVSKCDRPSRRILESEKLGDSLKSLNKTRTSSVVGTVAGVDTGMILVDAWIPIWNPFPPGYPGKNPGEIPWASNFRRLNSDIWKPFPREQSRGIDLTLRFHLRPKDQNHFQVQCRHAVQTKIRQAECTGKLSNFDFLIMYNMYMVPFLGEGGWFFFMLYIDWYVYIFI